MAGREGVPGARGEEKTLATCPSWRLTRVRGGAVGVRPWGREGGGAPGAWRRGGYGRGEGRGLDLQLGIGRVPSPAPLLSANRLPLTLATGCRVASLQWGRVSESQLSRPPLAAPGRAQPSSLSGSRSR